MTGTPEKDALTESEQETLATALRQAAYATALNSLTLAIAITPAVERLVSARVVAALDEVESRAIEVLRPNEPSSWRPGIGHTVRILNEVRERAIRSASTPAVERVRVDGRVPGEDGPLDRTARTRRADRSKP